MADRQYGLVAGGGNGDVLRNNELSLCKLVCDVDGDVWYLFIVPSIACLCDARKSVQARQLRVCCQSKRARKIRQNPKYEANNCAARLARFKAIVTMFTYTRL